MLGAARRPIGGHVRRAIGRLPPPVMVGASPGRRTCRAGERAGPAVVTPHAERREPQRTPERLGPPSSSSVRRRSGLREPHRASDERAGAGASSYLRRLEHPQPRYRRACTAWGGHAAAGIEHEPCSFDGIRTSVHAGFVPAASAAGQSTTPLPRQAARGPMHASVAPPTIPGCRATTNDTGHVMLNRSITTTTVGRAGAMRRQRRRTATARRPYCATNGCPSFLVVDADTGVASCPICGYRRRLH